MLTVKQLRDMLSLYPDLAPVTAVDYSKNIALNNVDLQITIEDDNGSGLTIATIGIE